MTSMDTEKGMLYVVATPIGNLGDMTARAVEILREVDLIAAEDTRNSIKLLNHFDIHTPMTSYHEFNKYEKADELVGKLLTGVNIAIITDAGTPCISDPGEILVQKCYEHDIRVTSLPGPSAVITALTLAGFSVRRFVFEGFLPAQKQKRERRAAIDRLRNETGTIVLYEAPHHLIGTLEDLKEALGGERRISLCRELTKKHEEILRMTIDEALLTEPRGEYVLVIEGRSEADVKAESVASFEELSIEAHMERYLAQGMDKKEAMKAVAKDRGVSRRDIYNQLER